MAHNRRWMLFGLGMIAGVVACFLATGPGSVSAQAPAAPVAAQPPVAPPAVGRYQISSFTYGNYSPRNETLNFRGAYVIDTQTGEVQVILGDNEPVVIGSAAKAKPKK